MPYAQRTPVSTGQTLADIKNTLSRYGASGFVMGEDQDKAAISFQFMKWRVRFVVVMPKRDDFLTTETGRSRKSDKSIEDAYQQACRQKWRALFLIIKAKLESIESGIETFEEAFQAQLVLPNNQTMSQWLRPQLSNIYEDNKMPPLLGAGYET